MAEYIISFNRLNSFLSFIFFYNISYRMSCVIDG
nr:MAG TPA: hypothetical protein [Caudoviricetes sp.]DAX00449.1 MAG TPA: hypothetical protein [Bacteriophage sp.]